MANQAKTRVKQQYFIPMEVKEDTIITKEYEDVPRRWSKIGCSKVRTILIPATREQYYAYMRPLWCKDKWQQRHGDDEVSADKLRDEFELEPEGDFNLEEAVLKKELLEALHRELAALQDIDRTILVLVANGFTESAVGKIVGLSQKAVNKRKHKLYAVLQDRLEDYR